MNQTNIKFNRHLPQPADSIRMGLQTCFFTATTNQIDRISDALRTYATWLVRAARRKMADSGQDCTPQNTTKNKAELT